MSQFMTIPGRLMPAVSEPIANASKTPLWSRQPRRVSDCGGFVECVDYQPIANNGPITNAAKQAPLGKPDWDAAFQANDGDVVLRQDQIREYTGHGDGAAPTLDQLRQEYENKPNRSIGVMNPNLTPPTLYQTLDSVNAPQPSGMVVNVPVGQPNPAQRPIGNISKLWDAACATQTPVRPSQAGNAGQQPPQAPVANRAATGGGGMTNMREAWAKEYEK